jgi:hypothetical protein
MDPTQASLDDPVDPLGAGALASVEVDPVTGAPEDGLADPHYPGVGADAVAASASEPEPDPLGTDGPELADLGPAGPVAFGPLDDPAADFAPAAGDDEPTAELAEPPYEYET